MEEVYFGKEKIEYVFNNVCSVDELKECLNEKGFEFRKSISGRGANYDWDILKEGNSERNEFGYVWGMENVQFVTIIAPKESYLNEENRWDVRRFSFPEDLEKLIDDFVKRLRIRDNKRGDEEQEK